MVAAPYEMFNMGNKTHPQQPDIGKIHYNFISIFKLKSYDQKKKIYNYLNAFTLYVMTFNVSIDSFIEMKTVNCFNFK